VCVDVGNLVITTGHQKQEEEVKKQCKLKIEPRRDKKFCLAGSALRNEHSTERTALFQVRHIGLLYVTTTHISGTTF
jgi:hypothetical protein